MKRTKTDPLAAASALLSFQRGEDTDDAHVGALMVAEHYADLRIIRQVLGVKLDGE